MVREFFDGCEDNDESGVVGFGGRLNIRPAFQREFVHKDRFLEYKLMIYVCKGNDKEKPDRFRTPQELRNAIYTGQWISDAKRYFSKNGCAAYKIANKYMNGEMNRQAYLERAIKWIAAREGIGIEDYMSAHQHDSNASELWLYFSGVINWVQTIFPKYRKEMKGLEWGVLFNQYGNDRLDPAALETKITALMADKEVTGKSGVYEYLLSGKEKFLSLRQFDEDERREAYEHQQGICPICRKHFNFEKMHADHITPGTQAGKLFRKICRCCVGIVI